MLARILLLGSLAASATALHSHHQRPSLNFGSNTPRKVTADASHPVLSAFNANAASFVSAANVGASAFETGLSVAESFLKQLHPQQEFRLQSKTRSAGGSVVHAYYVQVVGGRDVVDGLVNINVDTASGAIISYGDSAFAPTSAAACITAPVAGAHSGSQFVFGSANAAASSAEKCTLAAKETVDVQAAPIDPRAAIVSFLLQAAPSHLAAFSSLDDLVEGISVIQTLHSESDGSGYDVRLAGVPGAVKEVPAKLSYIQREDGTLALTWSFEYESQENWYEAHVSAGQDAPDSATLLMVVDWVRDAPSHGGHDDDTSKPSPKKPEPKPEPKLEYSYKVFPWSVNDPSEGKREIVRSPANMEASLDGWHQISSGAGRNSGKKSSGVAEPALSSSDGALYEPGWSSRLDRGATFKDTRGNNVFASANPSGGTAYELNHRPKHDETGAFKYHLGYRSKEKAHEPLDPTTYIDASITELFYTINEIHDLTWHYGFDEESGNFQSHNFGRGGLGGDPVVAFAQDGSGMNNANFATPPDGTSGRMRMYKWSGQTEADGDLEAGIVIHEYTHGISTRLTGGPANSGCLGWGQSGGMGEGYGDFYATLIRMKDGKVHDYTMGEWAAHRANAGIRPHPYSTNKTVNPDVFSTLNKGGYWQVHAIGSVYAEMLFEVAEALIAEHGWSPSLFPPAANSTAFDSFYATSSKTGRRYPRHGNTYAVQLLIDSFKLQPCRPNFLDNRDAILQADQVYTGGENACTIWRAFAKRGLGPEASVRGSTPWGGGVHTDDFGIPKKCLSKRRIAV